MQDLTPVGLSKDGTRLVLLSASGEEFAVPVDTRLRAALRGEDARLGQLEMKMDSALRPRDIQARIRSGETPEQVATAAQTTVEGIMAFASPVLAERAHVARTALRASVRRRPDSAGGGGRTLGDAADLFFAEHQLHDEDVEWDAWRRPDGRWALTAQYAVEGRPRTAEFSHDLPGRYVVAENDDARILIGELQAPSARATGPRATPARRLSSVSGEDQLPLGDDAIELVRDADPEPAPVSSDEAPVAESTSSEPDPSADGEDTTALPGLDLDSPVGADTADADWMAVDGASPVDEPVHEPGDEPGDEATDVAPHADDEDRALEVGDHPESPSEQAPPPVTQANDTQANDTQANDTEADDTEAGTGFGTDAGTDAGAPDDDAAARAAAQEKEARAARRKGRSSVPTWDEIMFGGGKFD